MSEIVTVVGVGADGWAGLGPDSRQALLDASVVMGSTRQLDLIPAEVPGERVAWPSPMLPALPGLLSEHPGICVLASGDPMFFGIGGTLVRLVGAERVRVLPHPSSVSLACARLGWALDQVEVVSTVGRPVELLHPLVYPGSRVLVLSADGKTPRQVVELLAARGYGDSAVTVLEDLGGPSERVHDGWDAAGPLNVVAVECRGTEVVPRVPGLPDDLFEHDGQITKREVRAVTLAQLAPVPGRLLWDVGAGAGSVAIEWSRAHPSCRAIAIERDPDRAARISRNASALGVPGVRVVVGSAPEALAGLDIPDAIFIGGGLTVPGVLERCWEVLPVGGRLAVNAVTMESETVVAQWHARLGGDLARLAVNRGSPVGGFTAWRPLMPVTTWAVTKEKSS